MSADAADAVLDSGRATLAEQAEEAGLPALAAACRTAVSRDDLLEAAEADLGALGLDAEQAAAAARAGEVVAWASLVLQRAAELSWVPDEEGDA